MQNEFSGKKALIVGGSSGIGKATAKFLLQRGAAAVVLVGSKLKNLEQAQEQLRPFGEALTYKADIAEPQQLAHLLSDLENELPEVDFLVNSAGVFLPKAFLEHTAEDYDRYHALNKGTFFITQRVAARMVKRGSGGAIVNIGSMWA